MYDKGSDLNDMINIKQTLLMKELENYEVGEIITFFSTDEKRDLSVKSVFTVKQQT